MPKDDRKLPDLQFGLYDDLVIFDHVQKTVLVVANTHIRPHDKRSYKEIYGEAVGRIEGLRWTSERAICLATALFGPTGWPSIVAMSTARP